MPVAKGLYTLLAGTSAVSTLLGDVTGQKSFYQSAAGKDAVAPYLILHLVDVPPAAHSMDGPSGLQDGEFQFDSYAADPGAARALSQAVRDALKNYGGTLSDGTTIQFYEITLDQDDGYEQGGTGYLFRTIVRLKAFFNESGGSAPASNVTRYTPTLVSSGPPAVYSVPVTITPSGQLFRNGALQTAGDDYTYSGANIVWIVQPGAGDVLAFYQ